MTGIAKEDLAEERPEESFWNHLMKCFRDIPRLTAGIGVVARDA